jgi:MinD-like ATPase involved in chromosome partitioning or flagellar assembly
LSDFLKPGCFNARELIQSDDGIDPERLIKIRENLCFVPAFDPADQDRFSFNPNQIDVRELARLIENRVSALRKTCDANLVVMDCHGGLDHISYASFETSLYTMVISEPDLVTFNGTLELFEYYVDNFTNENRCVAKDGSSPNQLSDIYSEYRLSPLPNSKVIFVLNRMSGRFSYKRLLSAYRRQLTASFPPIASIIKEYIVIPADSRLSRSFSEYPFYIELLPESIFVQKLNLIYGSMFGRKVKIRGRSPFYNIFERRGTRKLERYFKADDERRSQAVFAFTAAVQFGLLVAVISFGYLGHLLKVEGKTAGELIVVEYAWIFRPFYVMVGIVSRLISTFLSANITVTICDTSIGYFDVEVGGQL